MTHCFPKALTYLALLFLLASCGGGGGGESNSPISGNPGPSSPPNPTIDPSLPAPSRISQSRPIPGSVTQSSNTNGILTSDKIEVSSNEDGSYNVIKNNNNFGRVSEGTNNYLETSTSNLVANLHKYSDGGYMLYGTWSERKTNGSLTIDNLFTGDVGVFVDGSNEYEGSISQLTGTAIYENNVKFTKYNTNSNYYRSLCGTSCEGFSLYQSSNETEAKRLIDIHKQYNDGFAIGNSLEGNMILTANFGDSNSLGHIEGEINQFTDKQIVSYENIGTSSNPNYALTFDTIELPGKLNLERLTLGESNNGFFDGNLQGNINSRNYKGKWGGQFYSYDSNHDYPTNMAGTLAATSGDFNIIAPWFISHNEISASLLPIHFIPPQEDNPRIGLVSVSTPDYEDCAPSIDPLCVPSPSPSPTPEEETPVIAVIPTPSPSPSPTPVTPPTTVADTDYKSINGFSYTLVKGPKSIGDNSQDTSFTATEQNSGYGITDFNNLHDFNDFRPMDCPLDAVCQIKRIEADYSSDKMKWYYRHNNDKGEFISDVNIRVRFNANFSENILEPDGMDLRAYNATNKILLPEELYVPDITIYKNGKIYSNFIGDTPEKINVGVKGNFWNENYERYKDFPGYVTGQVWYIHSNISLYADGVFVAELEKKRCTNDGQPVAC